MQEYLSGRLRFTVRNGRLDTPCWEWQGATNSKGYGSATVAGVRVQTHAYAYEVAYGPIPVGWQLHHVCRNRRCLRPDHLEELTPLEHARAHKKGAAA